jgi:hypothetical protein
MDKVDIFNNIEDFTAKQLFEFINQGTVTLEELKNTGNLDASKRKAIIDLQTALNRKDNEAWERCRYGNEAELEGYISEYPNGKHVEDAKDRIKLLKQQSLEAQAAKQKILNKLRQDTNSYTPRMIKEELLKGTITEEDLCSYIPRDIIDKLDNIVTPGLKLGETPMSIPEGYTEVYFWGIPGSGKTCALAAILSTAEKLGWLEIARGPGYDYMVLLKNIFADSNAFLPAGSPVDTTQYLPFVLRKPEEKYARSVSLIELSGEIFQCFLLKNASKQFFTSAHENTFDALIRFLNGSNRKIHFFFVDYASENKKDASGYTQADYLNAAATFFNDKQNNFFGKTTDAIYIVVTKSDLMDCEESERINHISQYLHDKNFMAFVNSLRTKCKENSINGNRLLGTPFALGKVYLQQVCVFENTTSYNIIDILMRRIAPQKKSILDVFNK